MGKIILFFIPKEKRPTPELFRKYQLIVSILLITFLFDLNYSGITVLIEMQQGTKIMILAAVAHALLLLFVRFNLSYVVIANLYVLFGVVAIDVCIYNSGGFVSPVLPWLASSPIVALLMAGKKTGILWLCINSLTVIFFSVLDKQGHAFPIAYDKSWMNIFATNCYTGLILIVFFVSLVFENGKNSAQKKLAEQSLLLAEEKKKTALNNISMELHDNVGQSLSLLKTNLHLIDILKEQNKSYNLRDSVELLGSAIQKLRNISHEIYTEEMEGIDIIDYIGTELQTIERIGGIKTQFQTSGDFSFLKSQTRFVLTRVFKEILNNVIKHSGADTINVCLYIKNGALYMRVSDNGIGMNLEKIANKGLGIKSIYSRIRLIGGEFDLSSSEGNGTTLLITVPLNNYLF